MLRRNTSKPRPLSARSIACVYKSARSEFTELATGTGGAACAMDTAGYISVEERVLMHIKRAIASGALVLLLVLGCLSAAAQSAC
jgi:hypothetical protein